MKPNLSAKQNSLAGAYYYGGGTAVPANQFGKQTYNKQGKGQWT